MKGQFWKSYKSFSKIIDMDISIYKLLSEISDIRIKKS